MALTLEDRMLGNFTVPEAHAADIKIYEDMIARWQNQAARKFLADGLRIARRVNKMEARNYLTYLRRNGPIAAQFPRKK